MSELREVSVLVGARESEVARTSCDQPRLPNQHHGFGSLEGSLVCACAAPAASLPVAVQIRQNVALLADSPTFDELRVEPSPEGRSVALKFIISGHGANGTVGF